MRASEILNETSKNELYHVTHTKHVPSIQKNGLHQMGADSNWVQQGSGERYGAGEIYMFTNKEDANRWAGRMDWDFNQTLGSGEISIITFGSLADHKFEKDEGDPMSQAGQQGEWLKTYAPVPPQNIINVEVYDPKKLNEGVLEIEFTCVNDSFPDATKQEQQDELFASLRAIPDALVYRQEFGEHNSMAIIVRDEDAIPEIKRLAAENNITIDEYNEVSEQFVDSIYNNTLEQVTDWYAS